MARQNSKVQCPKCKVWYTASSLEGQAVIKSKQCLTCLEVEVAMSPISWRNRRRPRSSEEFEEMYGLTLQDLPGGINHDD